MMERLNRRQVEILKLRAEGLANQEIADRLGIAEGTVKVYFHEMSARTGINTRALVGMMARQTAGDVLREHSLKLKEWKERRAAEISAEALAELNQVLLGMLADWARL